ncbi:MAG: hypothetical protein ACJ746_10590 [Bryobacteraceae bacterium]
METRGLATPIATAIAVTLDWLSRLTAGLSRLSIPWIFLTNHLFAARLSADMLPIGPPRSLHFDTGYVSGIACDAHGQNLLVSADRLWKVPLNPRHELAALNVGDASPRELIEIASR